MNPRPRISLALFCLLAFYHALFLLAYARLKTYPAQETLFNADSLFLQDFAQDILSGWDFRDWKFPIAPFLFPDALLSFPAALIGWNNPTVYLAVYGYLQVAIALFGIGLIASSLPSLVRKDALERKRVAIQIAMIFGCTYWTLLAIAHFLHWPLPHANFLLIQPILPQSHSGSYAWTLVCYGVFLRWKKQPAKTLPTLLVALVLGCAGNTLFLATTVLPIACCLTVTQILGQRPLERGHLIFKLWPIVLPLTFYIGRQVSNLIPHEKLETQSTISLETSIAAFVFFVNGFVNFLQHREPTHVIFVLAAVAFFVWSLYLPRRLMRSKVPANLTLLVLFGSAAVLTPAALIAGGSSGLTIVRDYGWTLKYLSPMVFGPTIIVYLLACSSIYLYLSARKISIHAFDTQMSPKFALAGACLFVLTFVATVRLQSGVFRYRPSIVTDVVQCEELKDVNSIYCDFWQTRLLNLFAAERFRARPVFADLTSFHWLSNRKRIGEPGVLPGSFAMLIPADGVSADAQAWHQTCLNKLGVPATKVQLNDKWLVWIYKGNENTSHQASVDQPTLDR